MRYYYELVQSSKRFRINFYAWFTLTTYLKEMVLNSHEVVNPTQQLDLEISRELHNLRDGKIISAQGARWLSGMIDQFIPLLLDEDVLKIYRPFHEAVMNEGVEGNPFAEPKLEVLLNLDTILEIFDECAGAPPLAYFSGLTWKKRLEELSVFLRGGEVKILDDASEIESDDYW